MITLDDKTADELYDFALENMSRYWDNQHGGSDQVQCLFCYAWKYAYNDGTPNHSPLKHKDDCLGSRILALTKS